MFLLARIRNFFLNGIVVIIMNRSKLLELAGQITECENCNSFYDCDCFYDDSNIFRCAINKLIDELVNDIQLNG